jgi:hypothetical protein
MSKDSMWRWIKKIGRISCRLFTLRPALDRPTATGIYCSPVAHGLPACHASILLAGWLTRGTRPRMFDRSIDTDTPVVRWLVLSQYCSRYTSKRSDCKPRVLSESVLVATADARCMNYQPYGTCIVRLGWKLLLGALLKDDGLLRDSDHLASCMQGRQPTSFLLWGFRGWTIHTCRRALPQLA